MGSQIPNSLIPSEYHIVKNPGVMGLEFQEEYVYVLFIRCSALYCYCFKQDIHVHVLVHIYLNAMQLLTVLFYPRYN